jgi:antibiotic biosynthesis monooxygenase (ABM) superfamily enzyme
MAESVITDVEQGKYIELTQTNVDHQPKAGSSTATYRALVELLIPENENQYFCEAWLPETYRVLKEKMPGFKTRHIHPMKKANGFYEYVIVLVFDALENFQLWMESEEREQRMILLRERKCVMKMLNAYGGAEAKKLIKISSDNSIGTSDENILSIQASMPVIPKPSPPAKWKISVILVVTVFVTVQVALFGGTPGLMTLEEVPAGTTLFVLLVHVVCLLVYAVNPLIMNIPFVEAWLKVPRQENMSPFHSLLHDGLGMFIPAPPFSVPPAVLARISKLEAHTESLRSMNNKLKADLRRLELGLNPDAKMLGEDEILLLDDEPEKLKAVRAELERIASGRQPNIAGAVNNEDEVFTTAVRHFVKWECVPDFEDWAMRMEAEMARYISSLVLYSF